jgi:hypothetical protein
MPPGKDKTEALLLAVSPTDRASPQQSQDVCLSDRGDSAMDLQVTEVLEAWLVRTPSLSTRENYSLDLNQFLDFVGVPVDRLANSLKSGLAMWPAGATSYVPTASRIAPFAGK